jgi:mRNA interferase MazF
MSDPGDVIVVDFVGVTGTKRRPAVVVSSDLYHTCRSDVIVGLLTSKISSATTPMDYVLLDWASSGLKQPSAYRAFLGTYVASSVHVIGRLSDRDWSAVQAKLGLAVAAVSKS